MIIPGRQQSLVVSSLHPNGVLLKSAEAGAVEEVLMPVRYVLPHHKVGNTVEVFVYFDSDDRLVATTEKPYVQVGQFAVLDIVEVNHIGAFADWGLSKHLLVPFSEQRFRFQASMKVMLHVYRDNASGRIVASSRLNRFLDQSLPDYSAGEQVRATVAEISDLGYKMIIDNAYWGLLFHSEVVTDLSVGDSIEPYIKQVRSDGKIDLTLQAVGAKARRGLSSAILDYLQSHEGFMALNDKSSPAEIFDVFACSKGAFKKAIGGLYRDKSVRIERDGVYLNPR